jgi:hypothetical protein
VKGDSRVDNAPTATLVYPSRYAYPIGTSIERVYREPRRWVMVRFEKKVPPVRQVILGRIRYPVFFNHGIRGIHGKGARILVGLVSVCSVCSVAVATCRQTVEALLAPYHQCF